MVQALKSRTVGRGLVVLFVLSLCLPAHAYTKLYSFKNLTGVNQTSVKATTNGLEVITSKYAVPSGWSSAIVGSALVSGVYCTTLTYSGAAQAPNTSVTIGWTTADNSCRLRDLRWGGGQAIVPTQIEGVPGGGMVFYNYPNPGDLTIVITNDTDGPLTLSDIEYTISEQALGEEDLAALASGGFVGLLVAAIDRDIAVLRADVVYHGSLGELPSPSVNSLVGKLDKAAAYKEDGLTAYLAGNQAKALFLWQKAAQVIQTFIAEIKNLNTKSNIPQYLYLRWLIDGGGEITTAPEIYDALLALPNGPSLQSLTPLPPSTPLPSYAGLDPANYVQWPIDTLLPGQFTAFISSNMSLLSSFLMRGSVVDSAGVNYLDWIEQGVAEPAPLDTTPPVITSASATPDQLWPPDHVMIPVTLSVTVVDESPTAWYISEVSSNQSVSGTGSGDTSPDWIIDLENLQSLQLREERSGNDPTEVRIYTVTLMAIDAAGNISEPYLLQIPVDHDQG